MGKKSKKVEEKTAVVKAVENAFKRGRKAVDPNETKAIKFVRLAESRVPKVIKAMQQVGNLTGTGYEYTPAQAAKVLEVVANAYTVLKDRFAHTKAAVTLFKL
jgi:hypothetical protein